MGDGCKCTILRYNIVYYKERNDFIRHNDLFNGKALWYKQEGINKVVVSSNTLTYKLFSNESQISGVKYSLLSSAGRWGS